MVIDMFPHDWPPRRVDPYLQKHVPDAEDRTHLRGLMADMALARHMKHPNREAARSFESFASLFLSFIQHLCRVRARDDPPLRSLRDMLPRTITRAALRTLLAKVLVVHAGRRPLTEAMRRFLCVFRSAVRSGLFPNVSTPLSFVDVWNEAATLPPPWKPPTSSWLTTDHRLHLQRRRVEVTDEHVQRLTSLPDLTTYDRLYLCLLYTTGLRNGAVCGIRVEDVWDDTSGTVRETFAVREKNSTTRIVVPRPELRARVEEHVRSGERGTVYLLETRRGGGRRPTPRGLQLRLRRLCQRAGIPHLSPHRFRAFVVNHGMSRGANLKDMCTFLGHACMQTTYQHYWTRSVDERVGRAIGTAGAAAPPDEKKRAELRSLREEIARLTSLREERRRFASATVRFTEDTICVDVDGLLDEACEKKIRSTQ